MIAKTHECMGWKKCLQEEKVLNLNVHVRLYVLSNKAMLRTLQCLESIRKRTNWKRRGKTAYTERCLESGDELVKLETHFRVQ